MSATVTANVWVKGKPGSGLPFVFLVEGDEIPDWALPQLGDHVVLDGGATTTPTADDEIQAASGDQGRSQDEGDEGEQIDYAARYTVAELKKLIADRNADRDDVDQIHVPDKAKKPELVDLLTADDAIQAASGDQDD